MKKQKLIALLLAGVSATIGMGSIPAFADETLEFSETTETSTEVRSAEEAIDVLGLQESTEAIADENEFAMPEETIPVTIEDEQEIITTTTLEVDVVVKEESSTTTVAETSVTTKPIITTALTETDEKGSAPLNYYDEVVLMLDISGSMKGEPVDAMKDAATMICEEFLKNDPSTSISIVTFESDVKSLINCNDLTKLKSYINNLKTGNMTNAYKGMEEVKLILDNGTGERKSVIIMLDGIPNKGNENYTTDYGYDSYQNASLQYDNENLKTDATVYSIGFFHKGSTAKNEQYVRDLASDSQKSYIIEDGDKLPEVFKLIFNDIVNPDPIPDGKTEDSIFNETPVGTTSTPKTGDKGISIIIGIMALAGIGIVIGKTKK